MATPLSDTVWDEWDAISESLKALRDEFPADQVGQLPKGGTTLDYVGHGAVTKRLLDVDPLWNWEPVATDPQGRPLFDVDGSGNPVGLWIRLTVCGVQRLGYGSCNGNQFEAEKVLIGDALRNAAMRFGVALDLWVRGHAEDDEQVSVNDNRPRQARGKSGGAPVCVVCGTSLAGADVEKAPGGWAHKGGNCPEKPAEDAA